MKKLVAIFFLLTYGFTSVGATIHMHFCMDEYVGWNLWHSKDSKCNKCGMKEDAKKKGCCKDEHKEIKVKNEHQKGSIADFVNVFFAPALLTPVTHYNFTNPQCNKLTYINFHPPPNIQDKRLYLLYGVFLI